MNFFPARFLGRCLFGEDRNPYRRCRANRGGASALLQDSFTGTNGTNLASHTMEIGSGWTAYAGSWDIQGGKAHLVSSVHLRPVSSGDFCECVDYGDGRVGQNVVAADAAAHEVTLALDYAKTNNSSDDGVVGRLSDNNNNNYWLVRFDGNGNAILYEKNAGSFTQRASGSLTWSTSAQSVAVTFASASITVTVAGVEICNYGSASFNQTATRFGLRCNDATNQGTWDNFTVM